MSYEQAVRAKQEFQAKLIDFFRYTSAMTTEEMELALGRIADRLCASPSEQDGFHYQIRGTALKIYFDLRQASQKRHAVMMRHRLKSEMKDYFISLGESAWQKKANQQSMRYKKYLEEYNAYKTKLHDWELEVESIRKSTGFFKRAFSFEELDLPREPKPPETVAANYPIALKGREVKRWKQKANLETFLIEKVSEFPLFRIPFGAEDRSQVYDVTPADVKLLAP